MAKRFIDTGIFNDEWFMELSIEAKLLHIYFITNCDHAGIIKVNWKLLEFVTGIKDLQESKDEFLKEFGKRLVVLDRGYLFIPKFIWFQYPNFPNSSVKQQIGAINRLKEFGLFDEENGTLNKEVVEFYSNINGNAGEE